ncbi:MAG: 2-phospho-L-lactate transferase [Acidimicrobiales bacterium]
MITALAGGVGAARFLVGLSEAVEPSEICVIVNTGDDEVLHGLHISPDLDTVTYTLAGAINPHTGWGLAGETWAAMEALERYGGKSWFRLGDSDLGTHLYRTQRLAEGAPLSAITAEIANSWGLAQRLIPMSDDPVRTRLILAKPEVPDPTPSGQEDHRSGGREGGREVAFQDYFVRLHHDVAVSAVRFDGAARSTPAPGVLDAIQRADRLFVCPSNPILSIGPILSVPGIRSALEARRDHTVAISPIVAGAAIKGPADRLMSELGQEASVVGVARAWAPIASTLVIDTADAHLAPAVEAEGIACLVTPTVMSRPGVAAALARLVLRQR